MAMLYAVARLLLHLGQDVAHDLGVLLALAWLGPNDGNEAQLGPRKRMVEIVLHEVVLRKIGDIACLHSREKGDVGRVGGERHDVDHFGGG